MENETHSSATGAPKKLFSARTTWEPEQTAYMQTLRELRNANRPLLDLTVSNPTQCGLVANPAEVLDPLRNPLALTYEPDPSGMLAAREGVCRYYGDHGAQIHPGQILLTASTSESYSFLFRLLCDPGDEVLIAQPSYPLFELLAGLDDVRLTSYPLFHDHGWWIDFAELERRIGPRTRAIIVVHPNNPTGHFSALAERAKLEELCASHGLALIVDEVFLDYALDPCSAPSSFAAGPHPALTFVLSGLSKIAALPQMKAAWIGVAGPAELQSEALSRLEIISDTFLSVSTPVQLAVPAWLESRHSIQQKILGRIRGNLERLRKFASEHPDHLRVLPPDAGWTAVLSLPQCGGDAGCAERLMREKGIVLHPGAFYGMSEPNRAVASLLTAPDVLDQALKLL